MTATASANASGVRRPQAICRRLSASQAASTSAYSVATVICQGG